MLVDVSPAHRCAEVDVESQEVLRYRIRTGINRQNARRLLADRRQGEGTRDCARTANDLRQAKFREGMNARPEQKQRVESHDAVAAQVSSGDRTPGTRNTQVIDLITAHDLDRAGLLQVVQRFTFSNAV